MKKQLLIRYQAILIILLMGLFCVTNVWADVVIRFSSYAYMYGEEQPIEPDYSQSPLLLRFGSKASLFGLLIMGVYFFFKLAPDRSLRTARAVYIAAWVWSAYLLIAKTTAPLNFLTSEMFSNFAPGILGVLGIFFVSADEQLWEIVKDPLAELVIFLGAIIFLLAPFVEAGSRFSGRRYMGALATILQVCAVTPIFIKPRRIPAFFNYVPLAATVLCGVLIQTRLTYVLLIVQLLTVAFLKRKRILKWILRPTVTYGQSIAIFAALGCTAVILLSLVAGPFRDSYSALNNRLAQDTRTKQASTFFDKVPLSSLILGVGYPVGDEFNSQGGEGIDIGYVNAAYVGGLPVVFIIFYFLALPGLRLLRSPDVDAALEVAPVCLAALVAFASSTVFDISPGGVVFMIIFGGRAYSVAHRKHVSVLSRRAPVLQRGLA